MYPCSGVTYILFDKCTWGHECYLVTARVNFIWLLIFTEHKNIPHTAIHIPTYTCMHTM